MAWRTSRREQRVLQLVDAAVPSDDADAALAAWAECADAELGGDDLPGTFEEFYHREFPQMVTLAAALAGPANGADIAQEAMLVAYRRWGDVREFASPGGWVRGVCLHKAISHVRRRASEGRAVARLWARRPATTEARLEGDDEFWQEVRRLPQRQAQVVALYYGLDLSLADVALTLECAPGTVKAHLHRARATLADRLGMETEDES